MDGLWELQKVDVDMIPRRFKPTYLKIKTDGSFYVSKENGDLIGIYRLNNKLLTLSSEDDNWFNKSWKVFASEEELVLNDVRNNYRGEQLRFRKIDKFPDFGEFQQALNGRWELYKTKENGITSVVSNTWFIIDEDDYTIEEGETVLEKGKVRIDTRHKKMIFENAENSWNARFVWDELRLENEKMGLTHRLRRK